jgi:hypothetical protein
VFWSSPDRPWPNRSLSDICTNISPSTGILFNRNSNFVWGYLLASLTLVLEKDK